MSKTIPIYLRLPVTVKNKLEKAAEVDGRKIANLAARIITEWVAANG